MCHIPMYRVANSRRSSRPVMLLCYLMCQDLKQKPSNYYQSCGKKHNRYQRVKRRLQSLRSIQLTRGVQTPSLTSQIQLSENLRYSALSRHVRRHGERTKSPDVQSSTPSTRTRYARSFLSTLNSRMLRSNIWKWRQ